MRFPNSFSSSFLTFGSSRICYHTTARTGNKANGEVFMGQKMALLKQAGPRLAVFFVATLFIGITTVAFAQNIDQAFRPILGLTCQAANFLRGPLGIAIVMLMFAVGAISLVVGGRKALPLMLTAAVGGILLAAIPTLVPLFIGAATCPTIIGR
jgi:hypothetical protein